MELDMALGLSTGPCSVVGCGASRHPGRRISLRGSSSGTFKFFAELSSVVIVVVLLMMTLHVAYFGWLVRTDPRGGSSSH